MVMKRYNKKMTATEIADDLELSFNEVEEIIANNKKE